jgi:hypothetical protein
VPAQNPDAAQSASSTAAGLLGVPRGESNPTPDYLQPKPRPGRNQPGGRLRPQRPGEVIALPLFAFRYPQGAAQVQTYEVSNSTIHKITDEITQRAYHLYEPRGRGDGSDVQDWLQAEQELLTQLGHSIEPVAAKSARMRRDAWVVFAGQ